MKLYRKKPVTVEAEQYTYKNIGPVAEWIGDPAYTWYDTDSDRWRLEIVTLEGDMEVSLNDYVIRGIQGEFYPCKPDIFLATYEPLVNNS